MIKDLTARNAKTREKWYHAHAHD